MVAITQELLLHNVWFLGVLKLGEEFEEFDSSVRTIVENIETIFSEKSFNLDIDGEILEAKHTIKKSGNDAIVNIIIIGMFL